MSTNGADLPDEEQEVLEAVEAVVEVVEQVVNEAEEPDKDAVTEQEEEEEEEEVVTEEEEKLVTLTSLTSTPSKQQPQSDEEQNAADDDECKTDQDFDDNSFDKFKRSNSLDVDKPEAKMSAASSTETLSPSVSLTANLKEAAAADQDDTIEQLLDKSAGPGQLDKESLASTSVLTHQFEELQAANRSSPIDPPPPQPQLALATSEPEASESGDVLSRQASPAESPRPQEPEPDAQVAQAVLLKASILESDAKLDYDELKLHDNDKTREQLNLLKYELKEKDLDIIQLQKEINELQLENKMLKAKQQTFADDYDELMSRLDQAERAQLDPDNPYLRELIALKREKDCLMNELVKTQDALSLLRMEKSHKSIDLYDPNHPDILHRKLKSYEKQVQDLEDENERCSGELCKLEKTLDKLKIENLDLKSKVSVGLIYKEQEEALLMEIAGLKNELNKLVYLNNQVSEENQRLVRELNERPQIVVQKPPTESVSKPRASTGTQTVATSEQPESGSRHTHLIREDEYEMPKRSQVSSAYPLTRNAVYGTEQPQQQQRYQTENKPRSAAPAVQLGSPAASSVASKSATHQSLYRSIDTSSSSSSSSAAAAKNAARTNSSSNSSSGYNSLSRTDDYLINNFRPFAASTAYSPSEAAKASAGRHYTTPIYTAEGGRYASAGATPGVGSMPSPAAASNPYDPAQMRLKSAIINSTARRDSTASSGGGGGLRPSYLSPTEPTETGYRRYHHTYEDSSSRARKFGVGDDYSGRRVVETAGDDDSATTAAAATGTGSTTAGLSGSSSASTSLGSIGRDHDGHLYKSSSIETLNAEADESADAATHRRHQQHQPAQQRRRAGKQQRSLKINVMRDLKSAQRLIEAVSSRRLVELVSAAVASSEPAATAAAISPPASTRHKSSSSNHHLRRHKTFSYRPAARPSLFDAARRYNDFYDDEDDDDYYYDGELSHKAAPGRESYGYEDEDLGRPGCRSKSADTRGERKQHSVTFSRDPAEAFYPTSSSLHDKTTSTATAARKRPFVPLKPEDVRLGDSIKFARPGGKISKGVVKYIGPLPDKSDVYFGLELDEEEGKHDGIYQNQRFFNAKPNKGVFVCFNKVVMAWG